METIKFREKCSSRGWNGKSDHSLDYCLVVSAKFLLIRLNPSTQRGLDREVYEELMGAHICMRSNTEENVSAPSGDQ